LGFAGWAAWAAEAFVVVAVVAAVRGLFWVMLDADEPHPAIATATSRAAAGRRS
jgi:hypothetical protein